MLQGGKNPSMMSIKIPMSAGPLILHILAVNGPGQAKKNENA